MISFFSVEARAQIVADNRIRRVPSVVTQTIGGRANEIL